jgi:hypothetical protein
MSFPTRDHYSPASRIRPRHPADENHGDGHPADAQQDERRQLDGHAKPHNIYPADSHGHEGIDGQECNCGKDADEFALAEFHGQEL